MTGTASPTDEPTVKPPLWTALGIIGVALGLSLAQAEAAWLALAAAVPLAMAYRRHRETVRRLQRELDETRERSDLHLTTVEALALAIDAKDQTDPNHIRRVQGCAVGLAEAAGMTGTEIQAVKTAALLHDIGKLAVPEHILSKPGPLTPEEFQKVRIHPQIGADIISSVPFPYPVSPIILSHHERWDGKGYPGGLRGREIPLGARILAVVDHYNALISHRAYRPAFLEADALARLQQEAGSALDPELVKQFVALRPGLVKQFDGTATGLDGATPSGANHRGELAPGNSVSPSQRSVFDDIALAHREIYALYEIAQVMGTSLGVSDTMSLICTKLLNLVPYSCCALFLHDEETEELRCHFATGTDADLVERLTLSPGAGLVGWVATNRRPLVNARPGADFEAAGIDGSTTSLRSALVCPLVFNERLIGTLAVYHTEPGSFADDHRRLLDRVCEQAAAVIYNSILFEQTQEDSLTDPLTGLPNTRFMFMHLARELARAERLKAEVSLLVMDLDRFKQINDTYGHQVGDQALREIAAVLRTTIRPYDICVRYAGDEFIVVLSGCGAEDAELKRIELQEAVDAVDFEAAPDRRLRLSLSVGAAVFPHDGDSYEALLTTADSRMYRDKTTRRQPEDAAPVSGESPRKSLAASRADSRHVI